MASMQLPLRSPGSVSGSSVSSRSSQMSEVPDDYEVMLEQHIKLDALQRERREANDLLADKEAECDTTLATLAEKLDQRNKAYDELTRECVDLKTELVEKLRECFESENDLIEKMEKIYQLQKELDEKEKENDELQEKLDKQRKEYDQLRADSDELEDAQSIEVEWLNGLVCEAEEKLAEVTVAKDKECRKCGSVKRKAEQLAAELEKVESELAKVKSEAKTQRDELEAAKLKESTETEKLKKASQQIEKQKELLKFVLEREKNSLEQKDKERKREVGQLNAQLYWIKENSDMKKREEETPQETRHGVYFENQEKIEMSLKKVTADLTTSQKSEKDLKDKLSTLAAEMNTISEQLGQSKNEVARLKEEQANAAARADEPLLFAAAQNQILAQENDQMLGEMRGQNKTISYERGMKTRLQKKVSHLEWKLKLCQGQGQIEARASGSKRPTGGQGEIKDQRNERVGVAACRPRFEPARKKKRVSERDQGQQCATS